MAKKTTIAIVMGGKSAEHEVSLHSAKNIINALDTNKYTIIPLVIDKKGMWHTMQKPFFLNPDNPTRIKANQEKSHIVLERKGNATRLYDTHKQKSGKKIDILFPVIHGTFGEDGTLQGLCEMLNVPYVGPDVLGSAVGFDKDLTKRLLRDAGYNIAPFVSVNKNESTPSFASMKRKFGTPLFVKPARAGSSVGVHKISTQKDFSQALDDAFLYDTKILIEKMIKGRELECAVLGNENPRASIVGEVTPTGHDFYSYASKYVDQDGALLEIPAQLTKQQQTKIQKIAREAFKALTCEGMARVDVFMTPTGKVYINEINTIPGFTKISMYPKLWEHTGLSYSKLLDTLITLACERHSRKEKLKHTF